LVDSFDIIVRNNMLLPNNNYGTKNSQIQVLNCHIYQYYKEKKYEDKPITPEGWISVYMQEFGMSENHIRRFFDYLELDSVEFKHFDDNNTNLMRYVLHTHKIHGVIQKQLRCGLGYIAECIKLNIKPFLIGFSLESSYALNKQFSNKDGTGICHNIDFEIDIIKQLHQTGLIDATFCAIKDSSSLEIDSSLIDPTPAALDVLSKIYKDIEKG